MEQFLRKRGVGEDVLHKMAEQKVDEDAVKGMDDQELSEFLPITGDRYSLRDYVTKDDKDKTKTKKASLMDKLREKLQARNRGNDEEHQSKPKMKKSNAVKKTHRVELGWYHYSELRKMYIQVREKSGGGTRTILLDKEMNKDDVINKCTELFFPEGDSKQGPLKDMIVDLTDFQLKVLPDGDTTIGDIVDKAKLQKLRLYLNTRCKTSSSDDESIDRNQNKSGAPVMPKINKAVSTTRKSGLRNTAPLGPLPHLYRKNLKTNPLKALPRL